MNINIIKFTNIDVISYMTTMMAYKNLPYMTLPSRITAIYTLLWYSKKVNHTAMYREKHLLKSLWPSDPICVFLSKDVSWSNPAGSANLKILSKAVCVLLREISADPSGISWAHLNQHPWTIKLLSFFYSNTHRKPFITTNDMPKQDRKFIFTTINIRWMSLINNDKWV